MPSSQAPDKSSIKAPTEHSELILWELLVLKEAEEGVLWCLFHSSKGYKNIKITESQNG